MNKKQSQHYNKRYFQKKSGWLLYIVVLIFVRVVCSSKLTVEEQKAFEGMYLLIEDAGAGIDLNIENISINTDHHIVVSNLTFEPQKHTDPKTLNLSNSIDAKFYFKDATENILLAMNDGSLQLYWEKTPASALYKISNTLPSETDRNDLLSFLQTKTNIITEMEKDVFTQDFKNLAKKVDALLKKDYRRIPIPFPEAKLTLQQQLLIIACCIVFLIVVIILCVQCCRNQDELNTEALSHDQHETNDLSNHYPSSMDLLIDIKDTEPIDNTNKNTDSPVSITLVATETLKTTSTNLVLSASTTLEIQDSKSAELTVSETEDVHDFYSQEDEENSNTDDFTV